MSRGTMCQTFFIIKIALSRLRVQFLFEQEWIKTKKETILKHFIAIGRKIVEEKYKWNDVHDHEAVEWTKCSSFYVVSGLPFFW